MLSRVDKVEKLHNDSSDNRSYAQLCTKNLVHGSFEQYMVDEICKAVMEYKCEQFTVTPEIRQVTQSVLQTAGIAAAIEYVKSCT